MAGSRSLIRKLTHGTPPFGYVYIDKNQPNGARLEIEPTKAEVVKNVFRWRVEGMSMYGIAKRLNEAGILSAGSRSTKHPEKSRPPGLWSRTTVLQLLRNTTYVGRHRCSGIEVPCPAIIDTETFDRAQRMMRIPASGLSADRRINIYCAGSYGARNADAAALRTPALRHTASPVPSICAAISTTSLISGAAMRHRCPSFASKT